MWATIATIVLGAAGWVIARFLFEPYKEIRDLRVKAQEALIIFGNIGPSTPMDERLAAYEAFRRIGAGLVAREAAAPRRVGLFRQRWDIRGAGEGLISLGNEIGIGSRGIAQLHSMASEIRDYLDLPTPKPSPSMQRALLKEGNDTPPAPRVEPRT